MEAVISFVLLELFQSCDWEAFLVTYRISFGCEYDTDCCIVFKLKINLIQCSVDTCFHNFKNIILHTRKYNLSFRISKTSVVFKNLRSVFCQHQSEEDNTLERTSFCCHCVYRCLINIFLTEFFYFFCIERAWRKCSHTACIKSCISVSGTLMILRTCHCLDCLSINKRKYGNLAACHKFLNDHLISGCTKLLVQHDLLHACFCFFQILTDQNTFSECKSVCFQNNRELRCLKISNCCFWICKVLISCCWNIIFLHQVFGKCFRSLKNRCILLRSKCADSCFFKNIYKTAYQRIIHSYDTKINRILFCEIS